MESFQPPLTSVESLETTLRGQGFAVLDGPTLAAWSGVEPGDLRGLDDFWARLPPDRYLLDGGRYRSRRHGCFVLDVDRGLLEDAGPRPHFQPTEYNALHGGIERWFAPLEPDFAHHPAFLALLRALGALFARCRPTPSWAVEVHQFRIDTAEGIGRPTPEGAHRDGVDFVAVLLVARHHIKGGETRVFDARSPSGLRFTLEDPWCALLLDDERVIHESTPIQPAGPGGHRDTLVLTFRSAGFQQARSPGPSPGAPPAPPTAPLQGGDP
ncbi:MAG: 2OG-Fe dioxygenase family protein [Polyangiaceae bacterium]|nr:2OG-Fe dioxygenase family protein [Polyangiaceae bacterium]